MKELLIYDLESYSEDVKKRLQEMDETILEILYKNHDYENGFCVLSSVKDELEKMGIYSDIYHKLYNTKIILDSRKMDMASNASCRRIYDVYLTCLKQKDYRNAMRMIRCYAERGKENQSLIDLCYAELYIKLSDFAKAKTYLKRCQKEHQENPKYYILWAQLYFKEKEYESVLRLIPIIEKYDQRSSLAVYELLAEACYLAGDEENKSRFDAILQKMFTQTKDFEKFAAKMPKVAISNHLTEYPTNRNYINSFYIALDEEDWTYASYCLEKLEEKLGEEPGKYNETWKQLLKTRMREKGVQNED